MAVTFGETIKVEIYGQSHGESVGVRISGVPAGKTIDIEKLHDFMHRRAPGRNVWSTSRKEEDIPVFISGVTRIDPGDTQDGDGGGSGTYVTDGKLLEAVIKNNDVRQEDYENIRSVPRPSHADYPAWVKYGEIPTGGGQFSGRMTAPLCIAGGIFIQWLSELGIEVSARTESVGGITGEDMYVLIEEARAAGDSLGGTVSCRITGVPAGTGEPLFGGIESRICQTVFAVPAVKGIEFGNGFRAAQIKGSENNDAFCIENGQIKTKTNNHGGILGGLASGMPIEFDVAIKPTPSIAMEQDSVDLDSMTETKLKVQGRHDPCIVPRAVPCIEAAAALAIGDILMGEGLLTANSGRGSEKGAEEAKRELRDFRAEIDRIDKELVALLEERFDAARDVIRYKALKGIPILDTIREKEVIDSISGLCREDTLPYMKSNFEKIIAESRRFQQEHRAQYGLLGKNLGHSHSPAVHKMLGGYEYMLFDIGEEQLDEFLKTAQFKGLSITMPYKRAIIPYCHEISERAKACGSVNTVVRDEAGKLYGDNTDYVGFRYTVETSGISVEGAKVLVLGSGGVSGTAVSVMKDLGAGETVVISRSGEDNYENLQRHSDAQIIINATPVGMFPEAGRAPVELKEFPACRAVFDIVYNPLRTKLMLDAELLGIPAFGGLPMLVAQAAEACSLFTGEEVSDEKVREVIQRLRAQIENIVLIGMPGCGKTTVGRELAARLGREFIDLDEEIQRRNGKSPEQMIKLYGQDAFRQIETETLTAIVRDESRSGETGFVLATGGGVVERDINRELLRENGKVIYLQRPLDELPSENRPLTQADGTAEIYRRRHGKYMEWSDVRTDNNNVEETVNIVEQIVGL